MLGIKLRTTTTALGFFGLCSALQAQEQAAPITVPIQNGGVLHLWDNSWDPATDENPDPGSTVGTTIYNNDAPQGHYMIMEGGWEYGDYGRIPGPTSPSPEQGTRNDYYVTGFKFSYCTNQMQGDFGYQLRFYDQYRPCTPNLGMSPVGLLDLPGLPGSEQTGDLSCHEVAIDLRWVEDFYVAADGDDEQYHGFLLRDTWSWSIKKLAGSGPGGGVILGGDPVGTFGPAAPEGDGTIWHHNVGEVGTGLGSEDTIWRRKGISPIPKCRTIDNEPLTYASFQFELYADLTAPPAGSSFDNLLGSNYCDPAVNSSNGHPGQIFATGSPDIDDDYLKLWAMNLPGNHFPGYFLMGDGQDSVTPPGTLGPICVAGGNELIRVLPLGFTSELPGGFMREIGTTGEFGGHITIGSTWNFQAWYRDMGTSNLTNAVSVTFE